MQRRRVLRVLRDRIDRGAAFQHLEPVRRHEHGVRWLFEPVIGAADALGEARTADPNLPEVYYGLGVLYRLKGQRPDAINAFEKF